MRSAALLWYADSLDGDDSSLDGDVPCLNMSRQPGPVQPGALGSLITSDQRLGLSIYRHAQGRGLLKTFAAIISFLADEALWLGVPGFLATVMCTLR